GEARPRGEKADERGARRVLERLHDADRRRSATPSLANETRPRLAPPLARQQAVRTGPVANGGQPSSEKMNRAAVRQPRPYLDANVIVGRCVLLTLRRKSPPHRGAC